MDAIRTKPDVAVNSMRLRATQLLNMSGKAGRSLHACSATAQRCRKLPPNQLQSAQWHGHSLMMTHIVSRVGVPQAGRSTGNALGVLGLFFSSSESLIGWASDYALPDAVNSVLAGVYCEPPRQRLVASVT